MGYQHATNIAKADDDDREGSPNYWIDLPTDTPLGKVARLLADTLQAVHEVDSPRHLTYACSTFLGEFIPQPSLGLAGVPNE